MKIVLDENFSLALVRSLHEEGREVKHIILLGLRGAPDSTIIERLNSEELLFLTHDQEFLDLPLTRSAVIISRVTQSLPLGVRLETWLKAIREFFSDAWSEKSLTMESFVRGRTSLLIAEEVWRKIRKVSLHKFRESSDWRTPSRKLGRELELRSGDAREVSIQLEHENVEPPHRLQLGKYRAALLERPSAYPSEVLRFESAAEFV